MIQSANRFLLERINYESRSVSVDTAYINQVDSVCLYSTSAYDREQTLAADTLSTIRCLNCHNETRRSSTTYVHDLLYQPLVSIPLGFRVRGLNIVAFSSAYTQSSHIFPNPSDKHRTTNSNSWLLRSMQAVLPSGDPKDDYQLSFCSSDQRCPENR